MMRGSFLDDRDLVLLLAGAAVKRVLAPNIGGPDGGKLCGACSWPLRPAWCNATEVVDIGRRRE
jgi:hypothetical protein